MILARLLVPNRWRGIRGTILSRSFAEHPERPPPGSVRADEKYPSEPPNAAVFEETIPDTRREQQPPPRGNPLVARSSRLLASVVRAKDWELATRLRDESFENGTSISHNVLYADAALHAVRSDADPASLSLWLELYPCISPSVSVIPLKVVLSALLERDSADPTLLFHFGMVVADKGFTKLVREQVLRHLKHIKYSTFHYTDAFVAQLETVLLPETLPLPSSNSVFEEEHLDEYLAFEPVNRSIHFEARGVEAHIKKAVNDQDFVQAEYLLYEAEQLGIPISPDPLFLVAAMSWGTPTGVVQFEKWFAFIPPYHMDIGAQFLRLRRRLFGSSVTNMGVVIPFLQILARKGYIHIVDEHINIIRYLEDDVVIRLHETIQRNTQAYLAEVDVRKLGMPTEFKTFERIFQVFFATLKRSKRYDLASNLERLARLQAGAYFVHRPVDWTEEQHVAAPPEEKPKDERVYPAPTPLSDEQSAAGKSLLSKFIPKKPSRDAQAALISLSSVTHGLHSEKKTDKPRYFKSLARCLRYLRSATFTQIVPHPWTLMNFLERSILHGRTTPFERLRTRYFNYLEDAAVSLTFTELIYFFRRGDWHRTITTYVGNFHVAGLPRHDLADIMSRTPEDVTERLARRLPPRGKLAAPPAVTGLVWQCLAIRPTHIQHTEELYESLLGFCRRQMDQVVDNYEPADVQPLRPSEEPIGCEAFVYFLRKLMVFHGAERGIRIMEEMAQLGIVPNMYIFTEVAGMAARTGNLHIMYFILEKLESLWDTDSAAKYDLETAVFNTPDAKALVDEYEAQRSTTEAKKPTEDDGEYTTVNLIPDDMKSPAISMQLPLDMPPSSTEENESDLATSAFDGMQLPLDSPPSEPSTDRVPSSTEEPYQRESRSSANPSDTAGNADAPQPAYPREEVYELDPRFVFYTNIMRGLLIRREFAHLHEVHRRFVARYKGTSIYLDRLYADWHWLVDEDNMHERPENLMPGKTTVGARSAGGLASAPGIGAHRDNWHFVPRTTGAFDSDTIFR